MKLTDLTQEQAQMLLDCAPTTCDVIVSPREDWHHPIKTVSKFLFCVNSDRWDSGLELCDERSSPKIEPGSYFVLCTIAELDAYVANKAGAVKQDEAPELIPFDVELAKAGREVVTRGGDTVRILCYDRIAKGGVEIVALCNIGDHERIHAHCKDGKYRTDDEPHPYDLFIKPVKREVWVNLWRGSDLPFVQYNSIDEAAAAAQNEIDASPELLDEYIGPKQITWTE